MSSGGILNSIWRGTVEAKGRGSLGRFFLCLDRGFEVGGLRKVLLTFFTMHRKRIKNTNITLLIFIHKGSCTISYNKIESYH